MIAKRSLGSAWRSGHGLLLGVYGLPRALVRLSFVTRQVGQVLRHTCHHLLQILVGFLFLREEFIVQGVLLLVGLEVLFLLQQFVLELVLEDLVDVVSVGCCKLVGDLGLCVSQELSDCLRLSLVLVFQLDPVHFFEHPVGVLHQD